MVVPMLLRAQALDWRDRRNHQSHGSESGTRPCIVRRSRIVSHVRDRIGSGSHGTSDRHSAVYSEQAADCRPQPTRWSSVGRNRHRPFATKHQAGGPPDALHMFGTPLCRRGLREGGRFPALPMASTTSPVNRSGAVNPASRISVETSFRRPRRFSLICRNASTLFVISRSSAGPTYFLVFLGWVCSKYQ